ncbi:metallophosphoesterase [Clostridium sartagoforme]|uniref:Metallophosphoesterase n=1 Tax=Clostridium sartagoforme TaxID=84031 RepID=A0A4S2DM73_9CLOT|nr:metallophosphoesterase [Clostridium sartagoforme]TGY43417.1 metallophosphoesterase [Clostridium sartagoforme]
MRKLSRRVKVMIILALLIIGCIIFSIWQNNSIVISKFDYNSFIISEEFNNFKIVHISDLHNKVFGKEQDKLIEKVEALEPDIIVITGDLIDRRRYNLEKSMYFINSAVEIAPVYYVSGNHEAWSGRFPEIEERLIESGVKIIDDSETEIRRGNSSIKLLGLSDPDFLTSDYIDGTDTSKLEENLIRLSEGEEFKILLSHRPELFELYSDNNIDMIFSGHAHGGQIRLPFIGGLIAPDQGLFPKYTAGRYTSNTSTMYVSRGLGNSLFPVRVFNRPEIISVTLKSDK